MEPRELRSHKLADKSLPRPAAFRPVQRGKLPRPFHRMGGLRLLSSGMIDVSPQHTAIFFARNGDTLADAAFLGYLMHRSPANQLAPLFEFHWHPAHKGFHCRMPCRDARDFTGRQLAGTRELSMKTRLLDPRVDAHRNELVAILCRACGIQLAWPDASQHSLKP